MFHTNQLAPDTCGCVVEFTWADLDPSAYTMTRAMVVCALHAPLATDTVQHWDAIMMDNQLKNQVTKWLVDNAVVSDAREVQWSFAPDRVLEVVCPVSTTKNLLQPLLDGSVGVRKVRVR